MIKVLATAGASSEEESEGAPQYSQEELDTVVQEAHMWERRVAAHAHGAEGIKRAIRAGVNSVEHASFIDDEGIRLAKEKGAFLVMDIYNDDYIMTDIARRGYPQAILDKEKRVGRAQRENFRKGMEGRREDGLRDRCGGLSTRRQRQAVREDGRMGDDADGSDHCRDLVGGGALLERSHRHHPGRTIRGSGCRERRSSHGHRGAAEGAVRDEGRGCLQEVRGRTVRRPLHGCDTIGCRRDFR